MPIRDGYDAKRKLEQYLEDKATEGPKKKRQNGYTLEFKNQVIAAMERHGFNYRETSQGFNIPVPTLKRWWLDRGTVKKQATETWRRKHTRIRAPRFQLLEEMLVDFVSNRENQELFRQHKIGVTPSMLYNVADLLAEHIAKTHHDPKIRELYSGFRRGRKWRRGFLKRYCINDTTLLCLRYSSLSIRSLFADRVLLFFFFFKNP